MSIDESIMFDHIGGLDQHVAALKEMIVFPLLYPEIFDKYKIHPPRGVLFHGPPGTGKTLVARALCNECSSTSDRKVAFFMRKGADCLSKWVGESERQLRMLFDEAYASRPSIIFFDEIDGIAPVRSPNQDQIHSSIVSTLLALMDGLDDRGQVIIIGATNRIDAIDPALRRPGRFDREFYFPLPTLEGRREIIKVHTRDWIPPLSAQIIDILAARTPGYCGADLKGLCTETALIALKRRYPQIYQSRHKLLLNVEEVQIKLRDFNRAMRKVVPASQRSINNIARPLCFTVKPLLTVYLTWSIDVINSIFPAAHKKVCVEAGADAESADVPSDEDVDENDLLGTLNCSRDVNFRSLMWRGNYRPRFLIHGQKDQGQSTHLGPAILHHYEKVHHCKVDYSTIYSVHGRTPEESVSAIFAEVTKRLPCILYMPRIDHWWTSLPETLRLFLCSLIEDLEPHLPVLLLATSATPISELPEDLQFLFDKTRYTTKVMEMSNPSREERLSFFAPLFEQFIFREPPKAEENVTTETLPLAPPPPPRRITGRELSKLRKREEATLRELRLFLRECLAKLVRDKRFSMFLKPVDLEELPDYLEVVKKPMALETMMAKIDTHKYESASQFLDDIELICHNALEYNPDKDSNDRMIRHRACALRDAANAFIEAEMDSDFEQVCQDVYESRRRRGESTNLFAPPNYWTVYTSAAIRRCVESPEPVPAPGGSTTDSQGADNNYNIDEDTEIESLDGYNEDKVQSSSESISKDTGYRNKRRSRRSHQHRWKRLKVKDKRNNGAINGRKLRSKKSSSDSRESSKMTTRRKCRRTSRDSYDRSETELDTPSEDEDKVIPRTMLTNGFSRKKPKPQPIVRASPIPHQRPPTPSPPTPPPPPPPPPQQQQQPELDKPTGPPSPPNTPPPQQLIIDRVQVSKIFNRVVDVTKNCSVEQLEEVYSCLYRVINRRRNDWNRSALIMELSDEIDKFERHRKYN